MFEEGQQKLQAEQEASNLATSGVSTTVQVRVSRFIPQTLPGPAGTYGYRIGIRLGLVDKA